MLESNSAYGLDDAALGRLREDWTARWRSQVAVSERE
ncbi:hypothetical protein GA0070609_5139 [Micromonospora echinaurantiaca]|uniref:Uncharacterized protein n=1 Tax=Micromonospora echinaurantiaca TaxID=47857 RepID=A0A1C5JY96_9ACTN|nr:hypothetical protein GA0070609_5139 [Micromonospora echinaurantiaca]